MYDDNDDDTSPMYHPRHLHRAINETSAEEARETLRKIADAIYRATPQDHKTGLGGEVVAIFSDMVEDSRIKLSWRDALKRLFNLPYVVRRSKRH